MTASVAGPLPFGQKPAFKVPPGACDCHVHIFGPYDKYPLGGERSYTPPEAPVEMLLALMDSLDLDRAVIVNGTAYNKDSRILSDALTAHRDRLRGIAVLDPDVTTDADLDRLHEAGVRGIRINLYKKDGKLAYLGGVGMKGGERGGSFCFSRIAFAARSHNFPFVEGSTRWRAHEARGVEGK